MLKWLALLIAAAHAQAVDLNSYLTFSTPQLASQRSQAMCTNLNCDGVHTRCWWDVIQLTDNTGVLQIQPGGDYSRVVTETACAVGCGLTVTEQGQLLTAGQVGARLVSATQLDCP